MAKSSWCAKGCVSLDLYKFWKRARIFSPNHEQTCHRCAQKNVTTDGKHTIYVHGFFILYIKDNHIQHGLLKWCLLMRQICPQARPMDGPFSSVFLFFGWQSHSQLPICPHSTTPLPFPLPIMSPFFSTQALDVSDHYPVEVDLRDGGLRAAPNLHLLLAALCLLMSTLVNNWEGRETAWRNVPYESHCTLIALKLRI